MCKQFGTKHVELGGGYTEPTKEMEVTDLGGQQQCPLHPLRVYRYQVNRFLVKLWLSGGNGKAST